MNNQYDEALIRYRLEKADRTLAVARVIYKEDYLESAVNRIYYAMFYSVLALVQTKGFSSSKHSGIKAFFNREFVKTGVVDKELGRFYSELFKNRQKGDYQDFVTFEKEAVAEMLQKAEEFISEIKRIMYRLYLKQKLESAEEDVRKDQLLSHEEVVKETGKWFE
ncbi:MAG: HEPN domain-containing protein [bacterium]|nr:HEPN domain-containing protein [bacterium]